MHLQRCKVAEHHRLVQLGSPKNGTSQLLTPWQYNQKCICKKPNSLLYHDTYYETDRFRWQHSFVFRHQIWALLMSKASHLEEIRANMEAMD